MTDAVCEIKRALNNRIPLIGFSGSPFTLACYMVEGGSSSNYRKVKEMMYRRPDLFNEILEKNYGRCDCLFECTELKAVWML